MSRTKSKKVSDPLYEIVILGSPTQSEIDQLSTTLTELVSEFGLTLNKQVKIRTASDFASRRLHVASVGLYYAGNKATDSPTVDDLLKFSIPIIPIIRKGMTFEADVPQQLIGANGISDSSTSDAHLLIATAALECLGLLRHQRQIFISYRRNESRAAAVQLHDELSAAGFDVFLDTHDVRPGDPFQDVLWHRLCDSDVMLMLDTPEFFESKWTRRELAKSQAKEIHVLRIVWPDHTPERKADVGQTIFLDQSELLGTDGPLVTGTVQQIVLAVEDLRSRSIASRYMSITGKLKAEVEKIGGVVDAIGAHRSIGITLEGGKRIWAYPMVGVPTAATLNDIVDKSINACQAGAPVMIYDDIGLRDKWANHIKWLNAQISSVTAIKINYAAWELPDLDD